MKPTVAEVRELLALDFASTAEWRRERALKYPHDLRHLGAAVFLEHLAEAVSDIDERMLDAYTRFINDLSDADVHSEVMRDIGYSWEPSSATEVVRRLIDHCTSVRV